MLKMKPAERITAEQTVKLLEKYNVQTQDEGDVVKLATQFTEELKGLRKKVEEKK